MARTTIGTPNWGDDLNTDLNEIEALAGGGRSFALDHGDVSGTVEVSSQYAFHEMNLVGTTTIVPTGDPGASIAVKVFGSATLNFTGVTWDTVETEVPGTFILTRWPASGWRATVVGGSTEPVEVTPAAPTFSDGAGTVTIPSTTGVQYRRNGVNVSAGVISAQEGLVTITAVAKTGYEIAVGATVSWPHTFPGWSVYIQDAFTGSNGTLAGHVPNVTPNGTAWTTGTAPDFVSIASNAVTHNATGFNPTAQLVIPSQTTGLGMAIDVNMAQQVDTSLPSIGLVMKSPDNNEDLTLTLAFQDATDDLTITCAAGNGAGAITLTGTTTGLPVTGRYGFRWIAADRSIKVTKDGVQIATGTTAVPTFARDMKQVRLSMVFCKNSTFDNLTVETYS